MNKVQREKINQFIAFWKDKGSERSEAQQFWTSFLRDVLDVEKPETLIHFEEPIKIGNTKFIDAVIPSTHVLIEQKGAGVNLYDKERQSDGQQLTPFEQASRYNNALPYSRRSRWIVVSNFKEFHIYDMDKEELSRTVVTLEELADNVHNFHFLVDQTQTEIYKEMQLSQEAGKLVGELYNALADLYEREQIPNAETELNKLCVRLVFCLYAEDADLFEKNQFYDFLGEYDPDAYGYALCTLFEVLDTPIEQRRGTLSHSLSRFPYVNGGLFSDDYHNMRIPQFPPYVADLLRSKCSIKFDWKDISPTIFGSIFESTLNPEKRREGGMHYTSVKSIHKVIDPLFLDDLHKELTQIFSLMDRNTRRRRLVAFHDKLASLTFLDPACGSGNFLTETYLCLREMENDIIKELYGSSYQSLSSDLVPIKVSLSNFYGIEINDFAVSVAKTALWIAESQMFRKTEFIIEKDIDFLPLKSFSSIVEANATRIDWNEVVPAEKVDYIMSNPPYIGSSLRDEQQKDDKKFVFNGKGGILDYVACWYKIASDYIKDYPIKCAFVATNSVCQGQQVYPIWHYLEDKGIQIDFAHRSFLWDGSANVHCVITGFSKSNSQNCTIWDKDNVFKVKHINAYLVDLPNIYIESRSKPLCDAPVMIRGCQPTDDGNLILTSEEKDDLLKKEPQAEKFIRPFLSAKDFLDRKTRYCLWLVNANPSDVRKCPQVMQRIENVRNFRLASKKEATRRKADTPMLFDEIRYSKTSYVVVPETSSENRAYIPIDFLDPSIICSNAVRFIPDCTIYHFGILTSSVHMAWMRVVGGRLEMRYRYSNTIVYNNFPWPEPSEEQKAKIEETAQGILDARERYPEASLADLYSEVTMPPELRKAHAENDKAVMKAYGFSSRLSEMDIVKQLMEMYMELTKEE